MLFEEFEDYSKEQWIAKATQDLKGENVLDKYTWSLQPDISIQPYYGSEDVKGLSFITSHDNVLADINNPQGVIRVWENRVEIRVEDERKGNQEALQALNQGADGILFILPSVKVNLDLLLEDILLNYCVVSFQINSNSLSLAQAYVKYLDSQGYNENEIQGTLICLNTKESEILQLFNITNNLNQFRLFTISPKQGNYTYQIADTLIQATLILDHLTDNGIDAQLAFNKIEIHTTIGNDYFAEIAKIKALRISLYQLAKAYHVQSDCYIHARCTSYNDEQYAPHGNMIKGPTAAMSAIIGGCNSLTVDPEDSTNDLHNRIARNVSNILKEESYLDKVADPAAGSFYITNLVNKMAIVAWNTFKESINKL